MALPMECSSTTSCSFSSCLARKVKNPGRRAMDTLITLLPFWPSAGFGCDIAFFFYILIPTVVSSLSFYNTPFKILKKFSPPSLFLLLSLSFLILLDVRLRVAWNVRDHSCCYRLPSFSEREPISYLNRQWKMKLEFP